MVSKIIKIHPMHINSIILNLIFTMITPENTGKRDKWNWENIRQNRIF
jgi:hypothetical protein